MPELSVITTLYNCEKYVVESLQSVCDQVGFDDYEWLLLNDGSTDSTWRVVNDFVEKNDIAGEIKLIDDKENIRIPRRRNQAIDMAKGKYVCIHDGDDVSLPNRFFDEYTFLEENYDIFCVGGYAIRIDLNSEPDGMMEYPMATHEQICMQMYNKVNPMIDPTTMFRRKDFVDLGGYTLEKSIYTVPDMHLWCKAILSGKKMANIRKPMIKYRINPDSMTGLYKNEMIQAHMMVWRQFVAEYLDKLGYVKGRKHE